MVMIGLINFLFALQQSGTDCTWDFYVRICVGGKNVCPAYDTVVP